MVVGGWECLGGGRPGGARWFSVTLDRKTAPWAFSKGEPFKVVAALELYATLLCVMAFGDAWAKAASGRITITGATDNQGNSQVLCRLMSSKFPLVVVVLAELAAQLKKRCLRLDLQWVPRDQNEEADGLTNLDFSSFDPGRRMDLKIADLRFEVLDAYMAAATALYDDVVKMRSAGAGAAPRAIGACPTPGVPAASQHAVRGKAGTSRTTTAGPSPGVSAASDMPSAKAAAARTGAETRGQAAGGARPQAPRKRELKEVAPW